MAKNVRHLIYTTQYDEDECKKEYEEWLEWLEEIEESASKLTLDDYIQDTLSQTLQDEYLNLNVECGQIIAIADLGLWDGRHSAYKLNGKGSLNAIFDMVHGDDYDIFVEGNDVKAVVRHHDGTNYITFREVRKDRDIKKICDMLYNQKEVSNRLISAYTKPLGKLVANIYGW